MLLFSTLRGATGIRAVGILSDVYGARAAALSLWRAGHQSPLTRHGAIQWDPAIVLRPSSMESVLTCLIGYSCRVWSDETLQYTQYGQFER